MKLLRSQAGFSFVEVLITAFIFATALMGAVGIQAIAKKSSFEAQQRTVASYLTSDIIERLRLNKNWLQTQLSVGYSVTGIGQGIATAPSCSLSHGGMKGCSGSELNKHDLHQWEELMTGKLVQFQGDDFPVLASPLACIVVDSTGMAGVMITWLGRNAEVKAEQAARAHFGRLSDSRLSELLASISNLSSFADSCGLSDSKRHVYAMVTMIR